MAFDASPITAFTLIATPAVLTNAAAILIMSTSNRFSRTLDRGRMLAHQLDNGDLSRTQRSLRMSQFERAQVRTFLLLKALSSFYLALGILAVTSVLSIVGITVSALTDLAITFAPWVAVWAGCLGVSILAVGCVFLLKETRLAVESITEEAQHLRSSFSSGDLGSGTVD